MNCVTEVSRKFLLGLMVCLATVAALAQAPGNVVLNFRDAEISEVAAAYSQSMGIPFLLDGRVKGKITLESPTPVSLVQAYAMFVSSLSLQGFAVVEQDGYAKILPISDAKSSGVGVLGARKGPAVPAAGLKTQVFRLERESATQIMAAIRALVPAANPISANPQSNTLVVTDTAENLSQIARLIAALDTAQEGHIQRYVAKHSLATDLAQQVDRVLNQPASKAAPDLAHLRVTILPSARTNALIFYGTNESQVRLGVALAEQLDIPTKNPANVHVVYLKNAEAAALAVSLQGIFQASSLLSSAQELSSSGIQSSRSALSGQVASGGSTSAANPALSALSASTGEVRTPEGVIIRAEPTLNALIVVAPEALYGQIRAVIDRLDVRRAQVFIESLIVEVSADRAAEFGVQFQYLDGLTESGASVFGGTNFGSRSSGVSGNLLDLSLRPTAAQAGLNLGVIRGTINYNGTQIANLGLLARALETQGTGNVIATPNLLTLDNEEARITIGQNVPFITGSYSSTNVAAGVNPFQTIERRDVGTTLRVRPTVTDGGVIRMQIFQEVSSVTDTSLAAGLITNRRAIESQVLVDDEQIIVLGGLIEDREINTKSKVPLLGDIPVLGALFRYDTSQRRKTNLLVFLRPVILRNSEDSNILSIGRYDSIRKSQEMDLPDRIKTLPDFGRRLLQDRDLAPVKPGGGASAIRERGD